jgi:hypothetical protein
MHRFLPAFAPCLLAALMVGAGNAQTPASKPAPTTPAASTPAAAPPASTDAYREWQRQHEEWQRGFAAWEKRYAKWIEEQARLDDGFLLSIGLGPSPTRVNTIFSGGDRVNFPDVPPYASTNMRGIGGTFDIRLGWLVKNDPYLKDYWFGEDELHDQLYLTLDLLTRSSPYPQLRFAENDSANLRTTFQPTYMLDLISGVGMTYLVYPYRTSISTTVGIGLLGIEGEGASVRTSIGPALNVRLGQEWALRENWRSGFAVNYGYIQAINPSKTTKEITNGATTLTYSYQESYHSHIFSIQWINSFTPPKYRRGIPPSRPQRYDSQAPPQFK